MANYYYTNYGSGGGLRSFFPPVIRALIITNVVVYLLQHWFLGLLTIGGVPVQAYLMHWFALQPILGDEFMPWQMLSYQFMHGGFTHLLFNMFALWMFGSELESIWGARRFLTFYLLCGIGAALVHICISYLLGDAAPTVGASGSINGILLAFGFMFPDRPIMMFPIFFPIPAKILVLGWIAIDFILGITGGGGNVAHFAHVGGALCGYLLLRFGDRLGIFGFFDRITDVLTGRRRAIAPSRKIYDINSVTTTQRSPRAWFRASSDEAASTRGEITQEEIDSILDKIAHTGYNSLSDDEKQKLYDASKKL